MEFVMLEAMFGPASDGSGVLRRVYVRSPARCPSLSFGSGPDKDEGKTIHQGGEDSSEVQRRDARWECGIRMKLGIKC